MERWAELRREHFVRGVSIRALAERTGLSRNTVRRALRSKTPPTFRCPERPSKRDPFRDEIYRLLGDDLRLPAVRVREEIAPLGFDGAQTIVNEYVREARPLFAAARTYQGTIYRPGEICQFDLWQPTREIPVGFGQTRVGDVVIACLGYSRAGAIFSKEAPDILWGIGRGLRSLGAPPTTLVWEREGALHAGGGRPTEASAAFCGQLRVGRHPTRSGDAWPRPPATSTLGPTEVVAGLKPRTYSPVLRTAELPTIDVPWWNGRSLRYQLT